MKAGVRRVFLWSWVVTLPVTLLGSYWLFNTLDRFGTYGVRYGMYGDFVDAMSLASVGSYETNAIAQKLKVSVKKIAQPSGTLKSVHLFVAKPRLAQLQSHMPQSGFEYVQGRMLIDGKLVKAKFKYRGDTYYRWAWNKKSIRIKTSKKTMFEGMRTFNLMAARSEEQLNNYLSYKLAELMGLIVPRTELVRVYLNGEDQGVHFLLEQVTETTLRSTGYMPGDIYRGEIYAKDAFQDSGISNLFESTAVWDKVAINNHYPDDALAPLEYLFGLISDPQSASGQARLSEVMSIESWARFSAYETLTQSLHAGNGHNWRIYYDSWRQAMFPIVWDTMGWFSGVRGVKVQREIIVSDVMRKLFQNGDFLRARHVALRDFFILANDEKFCNRVDEVVDLMKSEIRTDSLLHPSDVAGVSKAMEDLAEHIRRLFAELQVEVFSGSEDVVAKVYPDHRIDLMIAHKNPAQGLRLRFDRPPGKNIKVYVRYKTNGTDVEVDVTPTLKIQGADVLIARQFLSDVEVESSQTKSGKVKYRLATQPGFYQIVLEGGDPSSRVTGVATKYGVDWYAADVVDSIAPLSFKKLYAPVAFSLPHESVVWSGEIVINGQRTIDNNLLIQPGTTVRLGPGASLVIKGKIQAEGSASQPIQFVPLSPEVGPWGAIALIGKGANGSSIRHCEVSGGSGRKGEIFEYSAMLSIHDVKAVTITDCVFRDNHFVDDMVHAVYADIRFARVTFENALADALDLDMSKAIISDSRFNDSGNDALDLMGTEAFVTRSIFRGSGDKGISVGEASDLFGVDNLLIGNTSGVQSKDASTAVLFNHSFENNGTALHAYKKNWQYGTGGTIFLAKSSISSGEIAARAQKQSQIHLFDSFVEGRLGGKRITLVDTDENARRETSSDQYLPVNGPVLAIIEEHVERVAKEQPAIWQLVNPNLRGARQFE